MPVRGRKLDHVMFAKRLHFCKLLRTMRAYNLKLKVTPWLEIFFVP